jgi:hypothetical protein
MTTAWVWLVRGGVAAAFRVNAGGALMAVAAVIGAPWLLASALWGRWIGWTPNGKAVVWAGSAVLAVTFLQWGWRWIG